MTSQVVMKYSLDQHFPNGIDLHKFSLEVHDNPSIIIDMVDWGVEGVFAEFTFKATLPSASEQALLETIALHDGQPILKAESPTNNDGRGIVHATARPFGTSTIFVGQGDDPNSHKAIGGGTVMAFQHKAGQDKVQSFYVDFNSIFNTSYLHEGYICLDNWNYDRLCLIVVPKVTKVGVGVNTNFNIYNNYLVVPAAGDGTLEVLQQDIRLVESPITEKGERPAGLWEANYDPVTDSFINLQPKPDGSGRFNMFAAEVPMSHFVRKICFKGDNRILELDSQDSVYFPHGGRIKFVMETNPDLDVPDHDWGFTANLTMFRVSST